MTHKESYENFIERSQRNSSKVTMPKGFTQNVMSRIATLDNSSGQIEAERSKVIMRWKSAAVFISSAAVVLLLFGLFSVSNYNESAVKPSTEFASQTIPVLSFEERIEIYRCARTTTDFIAELNK